MAQQDQDMAIESIGLTSTLGVVPTDSDGTQEDALRWLPTYSGIITKAQIRTLDRCPSADAALTLTGQFPDVDTFWARLAYVSAKSGWKAARATEQGIKQAEQANQTDQNRDESSHAILKASFTRAWTIGRAAWVAEHDAQLTGARMSGLVMRALRTAMGIEQAELADKLRVGERSVRAWESGETLANANVSAEIWAIYGMNGSSACALRSPAVKSRYSQQKPIRLLCEPPRFFSAVTGSPLRQSRSPTVPGPKAAQIDPAWTISDRATSGMVEDHETCSDERYRDQVSSDRKFRFLRIF